MVSPKARKVLVYTQLLVFGYLLTIGAWTAATHVKLAMASGMQGSLYPWVGEFFRPRMCKLFNYCFTAAAFACFYFVFLSDPFMGRLRSKISVYRPAANIFFIIITVIGLSATKAIGMVPQLFLFLAIELASLFYLCFPEALKGKRQHG